MSKIENTIDPEVDVEFEMKWNQDRYPDKPPIEYIFQTSGALAHLLLNEVIFLNTHWYRDDWPDDAKKTLVLAVNANDVFAWGCADAESIEKCEIETLYRLWTHEHHWGPAAWCIFKRKREPQAPVRKAMEGAGWNIEWLLSTTNEEILEKFRKGPTQVE